MGEKREPELDGWGTRVVREEGKGDAENAKRRRMLEKNSFLPGDKRGLGWTQSHKLSQATLTVGGVCTVGLGMSGLVA